MAAATLVFVLALGAAFAVAFWQHRRDHPQLEQGGVEGDPGGGGVDG